MNPSNHLNEKYQNKKLIIPDYYSPEKEFYSYNDLVDYDSFKHCLGELVSHEASITKDGVEFIKDYYGFDALSESLYKGGWFEQEFRTAKEIYDWLVWLEDNII